MTVEEYIRLANPQASEELVNRVKDLVGIKEDKDNPSCISPSLMIDSGRKQRFRRTDKPAQPSSGAY